MHAPFLLLTISPISKTAWWILFISARWLYYMCVCTYAAQGCQIWPFCGQDTLLRVHKLNFFQLQLMSDSSWSPSKYQNLALSAKFWYLEELQLDIVLKKNLVWQPCQASTRAMVVRVGFFVSGIPCLKLKSWNSSTDNWLKLKSFQISKFGA